MNPGANVERGEARVRWLIAGAFTARPDGTRWAVTQENFPKVMESADLRATVTVPDRLGAGTTRSFDVAFPSLKHFQTPDVIAAVPALAALQGLAQDLVHANVASRPDAATAVERVVAAVGDGKLAATVRAKLSPAAKPGAAPAAPEAKGADAIDDLLGKAEAPPAATPRGAIDSFLKQVRSGPGGSPTSATPAAAARAARDAIEGELYATAVEILKDPTVAAWEGAWRGLKMVLDQCPPSSGIHVDVLDVAPDGVVAAVRDALPVDTSEAHDAVFAFDAADDVARLGELAALGEEAYAPVIVALPTSFFGVADAAGVSSRIEDEDGGLSPAWKALRQDETSRWLCAVANRVVVKAEGTGAARRVVFGSPAAAVAAMLSASYRHTGAFARILGAPGALKAPGGYELPSGRDAGMLVPTEAFFSARAMNRLASLGVFGIGSSRNSDALTLAAMPTARAGDDIVPLPAQILTGRIVRFSRWVLDQVPAGATEAEVKALFEEAAKVFLFPVASDGARLEATVAERKDGGRDVVLQALVHAAQAGIPFRMGFSLPLPG